MKYLKRFTESKSSLTREQMIEILHFLGCNYSYPSVLKI